MDQSNPIPQTNTMHRPLNIIRPPGSPSIGPGRERRARATRNQPRQWRHPRWTYFLSDLNEIIMQHTPSLRPNFLELLSRIDTI